MLYYANILPERSASDRSIENYGRMGSATIQYVFDPRMWGDWAPLYWVSSRKSSAIGSAIELALDPSTGALCALEIHLYEITLSSVNLPLLAATRVIGSPVFDLSVLPSTRDVNAYANRDVRVDTCEESAGWTPSGDFVVCCAPDTDEVTLECVLDSTLSLFFDGNKALCAVQAASISGVDTMVIQQAQRLDV